MIGNLQKSIDELQLFLRKWSENLAKQLNAAVPKPGSTVGISFEPAYAASAIAQMEPVELGFYTAKGNSQVGVEVVGQDVQLGIVSMENPTGVEGQVIAEVMSYELFMKVFEKAQLPGAGS